ncbi:retrovirus-related pol polyprotein from transposon TNT 1-94 [Tanacetum coccineum]
MRTRSQARKRRQPQVRQTSVESSNLEKPDNPPIVTMADNRTMAQLLEAPTEGYEDAIVIPEITANNFEIKHGLLNLVQNKQFFGNDKEDPHAHIRYFNKITSTMKIPNVPNTSVKLMLFPFSLEGAARIWLEKEPPRSIETWDDLVTKFINKFFPPSKTTNLRNEITRFQQKFDETFCEAWDRFNDLLRGCPHHGFSELHQLDTFYNALNSIDQDSLNSAAGGNFLDKMPRECLKIIESKSKVRQSRNKAVVAKMSTSSSTPAISSDVAELKDMVRALILDRKNQTPASAPVKAVEQSCVTCGGGHSYQNCPATNSNMYHDNIQEYVSQAAAANFNQANSGYRPPMVSNQIRPPGFPPVDSGCSKHMTGNLKLLTNFVEKFLGTVKFGNDQIAPILGYGDLVQGTITIKRVYYVEGLNHNLFSVGQFCDADLEVAFRKSTCYIRDLKGNDLLTGSRGTDLYSISLQDSTTPNPICLMAKATSSQAWLWHHRLSHLNFDTINLLSKNNIVNGLPKLKFVKDHLCSSCELGKAKRKSFHTKTTPSSKRRLQLLHMDLCGPMRVESINGKKYVLVIVDDYSRYTWTHFLRSKDETPGVLIDFLTLVQRGLHAQVTTVRTDKGTKFLNKTLHAYFAKEGIRHETSTARTPEQNGVVERRNRTLVEAARTMLSAAKVPLFFWAEAIATACFTQNRSLVIPRHEKTPYHIINARKPSVKFFHIFGSLCYIVRDGENLDKMKEKGDACIFVGYSTQSKAYRVFNKRTRMIVETIHVNFDELPQMASDHVSSDPGPQCSTTVLEQDSLSPGPQSQENVPQVAETVTTSNELELLYSPMFSELLNGISCCVKFFPAVHAAR